MTYSIVARDSETGELGVAVQSRAFRASAVPRVRPARDDHPEPFAELRRLLDLEEGYRKLREPETSVEAARAAGMSELDVRWAEIIGAAHTGELERARELLAPPLAEEPRWAAYARALPARGFLPHVDELLGA